MAPFFVLVFLFGSTWGLTEIKGIIDGKETWKFQDSPFIARRDVLITEKGELTVQPGVEVRFPPGLGITVRGTIRAIGIENFPITFTREEESSSSSSNREDAFQNQTIRLVDGSSILDGKLQILYKGKWRSICTGIKNGWKIKDFETVCQHLGFSGGEFYKWYNHSNETGQLYYMEPGCNGNEPSVTNCKWERMKMGSGACDGFQFLGIRCSSRFLNLSVTNWRGIWFDNARTRLYKDTVNSYFVSESEMNFVNIYYAGHNKTGIGTSAINIYKTAPKMDNLNIRWSIYNGINISNTEEPVNLLNSVISDNRGHGIFINSSQGSVSLKNNEISNNGGNGIHFVHHNELYKRENIIDFITGPDVIDSSYPKKLIYMNKNHLNRKVSRAFSVARDHVLTLHVLSMFTLDDYSGEMVINDGPCNYGTVLLKISIINVTEAFSVVSIKNTICIIISTESKKDIFINLQIDSGKKKSFDLHSANNTVVNNSGTGIFIQNMRSKILITDHTFCSENKNGGIKVVNGSGDISITQSTITYNIEDGVSIMFNGGQTNITSCEIINNIGQGIAIRNSDTYFSSFLHHTTIIGKSNFSSNKNTALFIGHHWRKPFINITMNTFFECPEIVIEVSGFVLDSLAEPVKMIITHNKFFKNWKRSVYIPEIYHLDLDIKNNEFLENNAESLFIKGSSCNHKQMLPTQIQVTRNEFKKNQGTWIVYLNLIENPLYALNFTHNVLQQNSVSEPFKKLKPRSTTSAVIAVGSSNVHFSYNIFNNPSSTYELASQINGRYSVISASLNYWGNESISFIYPRIFDCKHRYNLGCVNFQPYLLIETIDKTEYISTPQDRYLHIFKKGLKIGGEVLGTQILESGIYTVTEDIYISPHSSLTIKEKTILNFQQSIGMMVQGTLHVEGFDEDNKNILFTYAKTSNEINSVSVRLVDKQKSNAEFIHEGRIEIKWKDKWGTVCSKKEWTIHEANVVCNELGLVLHPNDWKVNLHEIAAEYISSEILLSNVKCDDHFTSRLLDCKFETLDDFENTCTHSDDVVVRCYEPSWSGVRFGMMAQPSIVRNLQIEKVGQFDYRLNKFSAALEVDFLQHNFETLQIVKNRHIGLHIIMNNIYSPRTFDGLVLNNNRNFGLLTHTPGFKLSNTVISNHNGTGLLYDSKLDINLRQELVNCLKNSKIDEVVILPISGNMNKRILSRDQGIFILSQSSEDSTNSSILFETSEDNVFGIQILNPVLNELIEKIEIVIMYSFDRNESYCLQTNLEKFPLITRSSRIYLFYTSRNSSPLGSLLYIRAIERNVFVQNGLSSKITIQKSEILNNYHGISVLHYNQDTDKEDNWYPKFHNQSVEIFNTVLINNTKAALIVDTPYSARIINTRPINITYLLNTVTIASSSQGILQLNHDLLNSNMIFNWLLNNNKFSFISSGTVEIALPHVWDSNGKFHTLYMQHNLFSSNKNFQLKLKGHYADVIFINNLLSENNGNDDLISLNGMEKQMKILHNKIENNTYLSILKFDINSHAPINSDVIAVIKNNIIQYNKLSENVDTIINSFTIGTIGMQRVVINNNRFFKNTFHYEFFSGMKISSNKIFIDAKENWWGTRNYELIKKRIFDFDNSYNYAPVVFIPYALSSDFTIMSSEVHEINDTELGGRLYQTVYLQKRSNPYVIKSDITIMPDAELVISPGVIMEFFPNIGILNLGTLIAKGTAEEPITMCPYQNEKHMKRSYEEYSSNLVRLCNSRKCGPLSNGFLEIFSTKVNKWIPVCDDFFSELNGKIVCEELHGKNRHIDVFIRQANRTFDDNIVDVEYIFEETFSKLCSGFENSYEECPERKEFYQNRCTKKSHFTYIYCHFDVVQHSHWGGITFSIANHEYSIAKSTENSVLEYVNVIGAGYLHGEKCSAIQILHRFPLEINHISVTNSAFHGIYIIAPMKDMKIRNSRISDNFGIGINVISIQTATQNSLKFLKSLQGLYLPHEMFGLINMCDSEKTIHVKERVFLFYKYQNFPVNCIKRFEGNRRLEFKFFYFNLFYAGLKSNSNLDVIKIFDGDLSLEQLPNNSFYYNSNSSEHSQPIISTQKILSIQISASAASEIYGFLAEIHALPPIVHLAHENKHIISQSTLIKNMHGAISYSSVGETNPVIEMSYNYIEENGFELAENFTTSKSAIFVNVQNTRTFLFLNNALVNNQGGLKIIADSQTKPSGLQSDITNNLFSRNKNYPIISANARSLYLFQEFKIHKNIIISNFNNFSDIIYFNKVLTSFNNNYLYNNTGHSIVCSEISEYLAKSNFQAFIQNTMFNNTSVNSKHLGTITSSCPRQIYHQNIFFNPLNNFEIIISLHSSIGIINASNNWWGYNDSIPISARILDAFDSHGKVNVIYKPFLQSNKTVIEKYCPPGWIFIKKSCHLYVGGGGTEDVAQAFCQMQHTIMTRASAYNLQELVKMIEKQQLSYDNSIPVRIRPVNIFPSDDCSAIINGEIKIISCDGNFPFICEWGSEMADHNIWELNMALFLGSGVAIIVLIILACCIFCCCRRRKQKKSKVKLKAYQKKADPQTKSATEELMYMPFIRSPQPALSNSQNSSETFSSHLPVYVECVNAEEQDNYLNQGGSSEKNDESSSSSSDDDEKKSSSHETLPLVEEKTVFSSINIQPKIYLETSLDDIDDGRRYLETSLDNLDQ